MPGIMACVCAQHKTAREGSSVVRVTRYRQYLFGITCAHNPGPRGMNTVSVYATTHGSRSKGTLSTGCAKILES